MQSVVCVDVSIPEPKEERWSDFVDDLWDRKLPHFRRKGYVYSTGPSSPATKPAESPHSSKMVNELIHYSSEVNMLEFIDEEEGATVVPPQDSATPERGMFVTYM